MCEPSLISTTAKKKKKRYQEWVKNLYKIKYFFSIFSYGLGTVAHSFNPSTWESKIGGLWFKANSGKKKKLAKL
jgi:hypothetical protein